jgi:serine/threonine protein kinase
MGEEIPTPRFDPEDPKKSAGVGSAPIGAAGRPAGGEATLDIGGSGTAVARPVDRMSIGPYMLIRILGEGGMGQVWLAEQTAPVKRQVALKLIKGGLYGGAVIQRFESERQSLAVMNHPAIAKVFDAGSTKDGQPYFVMEYVDGPPITRYCDNKKLKIRERLEQFIKVCEGVQHAHQKAIIHRDLKPSNILVVEVDGKATPRIIDFGIAKAVSSQPGAEQTQFTEMGALVGTRGFISPEQADPNVLDVDTRTDVYSLGALLYVLLTGMLPFDSHGGKKKPIDEVLRQLREEDPPSPSTKISTEKETATAAAERRGTETKQLAKLLRGDLDWITMKAVEKDRARRYGTPSELAADIERYLENRPVVARPASRAYRLKKYVQRHRLGVTVAAGASALLVAFAVTEAVQLRRTTRERDRANRITDFMTNMFKVSSPSESRGNSVTAREILDKASKDIDTGLAKDPELRAQMMHVMGVVYLNLGLFSRAETLLRQAVNVRQPLLGQKHPETLTSMDRLAWTLQCEGHNADAEKLMREVVERRQQVLGSDDPGTVESKDELAWILSRQGHLPEAEKLQRDVLAIRRRLLGTESLDTAGSLTHLASTLMEEGHYAEAEDLGSEALAIRRRVLGENSLGTAAPMLNLAATFNKEGKYAEAEKLDRQVLELERRVLGPEHAETLLAASNLAWNLHGQGRLTEAEHLQRDVIITERRVLGPENPRTLVSTSDLASTLKLEGRYPEAEKLQRETLEIQSRVEGMDHPDTLATANNLADTLLEEGHYAEAEKLQRQTLEIRRKVSGPEHPSTLTLAANLAITLRTEGNYAEAEKILRETLEIQRRVVGPNHPDTALSTYQLACIAAHQGQLDEAFSLLGEAIDHGLSVAGDVVLERENDLKPLHRDPRFDALVTDAKQRAAAAQKPN